MADVFFDVNLQQHKIWRKCKLRVHTVAEKLDNSEEVKKNLERHLDLVRIKAEVQVLELDESCLAPYTFDYTIRVEEARAFAEEVANYRKTIEHMGPVSPDALKRRTEILKLGRKKPKDKGLPTFQLTDIQGIQHLSSRSRREKRNSGSPNDGKGSPNHVDDVVLTSSRSQRSSTLVPPFLPVSPLRSASISPSSMW